MTGLRASWGTKGEEAFGNNDDDNNNNNNNKSKHLPSLSSVFSIIHVERKQGEKKRMLLAQSCPLAIVSPGEHGEANNP